MEHERLIFSVRNFKAKNWLIEDVRNSEDDKCPAEDSENLHVTLFLTHPSSYGKLIKSLVNITDFRVQL